MTTPDELQTITAELQRFVATRVDPEHRPVVSGVARVGMGRSRENWLFDLYSSPGGVARVDPLIVRRDPPGGLLETQRSDEFAVLRALESTPVPAPPVRWLDADGSELGKPSLIMDRLPGTCDYYLINGDRPLADRVELAGRFCDLLADVHSVDVDRVGADRVGADRVDVHRVDADRVDATGARPATDRRTANPPEPGADVTGVRPASDRLEGPAEPAGPFGPDPGPQAARFELRRWQEVLSRDSVQPYPELVAAGRWLADNAPTSPRTVLVHGDFKPGNILLDADDEVTALLDWELAHLGDPHEDLGWVTQPLRAGEHLIPGSWTAEDLFQRYEHRTGTAVDRDAVAWWNSFASYKTAVMQATGLRSFVEGRSDEPYQPSAPVLQHLLEAVLA